MCTSTNANAFGNWTHDLSTANVSWPPNCFCTKVSMFTNMKSIMIVSHNTSLKGVASLSYQGNALSTRVPLKSFSDLRFTVIAAISLSCWLCHVSVRSLYTLSVKHPQYLRIPLITDRKCIRKARVTCLWVYVRMCERHWVFACVCGQSGRRSVCLTILLVDSSYMLSAIRCKRDFQERHLGVCVCDIHAFLTHTRAVLTVRPTFCGISNF